MSIDVEYRPDGVYCGHCQQLISRDKHEETILDHQDVCDWFHWYYMFNSPEMYQTLVELDELEEQGHRPEGM